METKTCKYCGRELPLDEFYKNGFGVTSCCKECHTKRMIEGKKRKKDLEQKMSDAIDARQLRLQDFTPRELMVRLSELGYEGKLRYTKVMEIDINNLE